MKRDVASSTSESMVRFSGHETFACRYAWLSKAYRALQRDCLIFADEDAAMVELGLGKNMVRSLRFWVEMMGVAVPSKRRGLDLTAFGQAVFGDAGQDRYLEDPRTLWLLHWNLSSRSAGPLFAWRLMLNHWPYPEFTRTEALEHFRRESVRLGHTHSSVTLAQHFDVFLHTYHSSRGGTTAVEDSLDAALVGLALVQSVGERRAEGGRWETVYSFRRETKPDITSEVFDYCLLDYWMRFRPSEETLTLREISAGECSPGQVFKLPEDDIRTRLEEYARRDRARPFNFQASAVQGLVSRRRRAVPVDLKKVYAGEVFYV